MLRNEQIFHPTTLLLANDFQLGSCWIQKLVENGGVPIVQKGSSPIGGSKIGLVGFLVE